jgi:hypothetical protein
MFAESATNLDTRACQASPLYEGLYAMLLVTMARDKEKPAATMRYTLPRLEESVA